MSLIVVLESNDAARADVMRKGRLVGFVIVRRHQEDWASTFYATGINAGMRRTKFHYFLLEDFEEQSFLPQWAKPAVVGPWQPHKDLQQEQSHE